MGFWEVLVLIAVFTKQWSPIKGLFVWIGGYVVLGILILFLLILSGANF